MGEWVEAYIESKDAEWDQGFRSGDTSPYFSSTDDYERRDWQDDDLPDDFITPRKNSCWGCKNNWFLSGYCRRDFSIALFDWSYTCKHFEKDGSYEWRIVWSMLYMAWRHHFSGNDLGFKRWMKTEEGKKYYAAGKTFLKEKGIL